MKEQTEYTEEEMKAIAIQLNSLKEDNNNSLHDVMSSYCGIIDDTLKACLIPEIGCGQIEYQIDGKMLYDKIESLNNMMKKIYCK